MSATPSPADAPLLVGKTLSHFRVLSVLGRGGMGVVYRAEDELLRRVVALKVLPTRFTTNPEDRERLLREARTAAALSHPNIATIYEVGEADGTIFIAMELVNGESLRDALRRGPIPSERALLLATEIARALARAHLAGIVHRDLKPENIMVLGDQVKLLDFGIAKSLDEKGGVSELALTVPSPVTARGTLVGTPEYMAPEQLRSEPVSPRADVFSFGVVLYELLTGHRPFLRASLLETAAAIWKDPPAPLAELCPQLPLEVVSLVERCLAKDPAARYADAHDLVDALRQLTGALTTGPRTAPAPPLRRGRSFGWLGVAVAMVAGGGAWLAWRAIGAHPFQAAPASASGTGAVAEGLPPLAPRGFVERRTLINGEDAYQIALSPDAKTIAYSAAPPEGDSIAYVQPVDGAPRTRIPLPPSKSDDSWRQIAGFFPDGALLMRLRKDMSSLWKVAPGSGAIDLVARLHRDTGGILLSPDGKRLLVDRDDGLYTESLSEEGSTRIASGTTRAGVTWSPGSDMIAYGSVDAARVGAIDILSADGRRTQHLLRDAALVNATGGISLAWPEPHRLVAAFLRNGGSALVELPLDDQGASAGPPRDLYSWPDTQVQDLAIAKGVVAFAKMTVQNELLTATLAPDLSRLAAPLTPVTSDQGYDLPGGWLDEARTLFGSSREGAPAVYSRAGVGRSVDLLTRDLAAARVMASGEVLGWREARADGGEPCALLQLEASGTRTLFTAAPDDDALLACRAELRCVRSGAGRRCVAMETSAAGSTWSPVDLDTGRKGEALYSTTEHVRSWDLSPAADTLAFTLQADNRLNYVALPSGVVRQVKTTPEIAILQFVVYAPDGKHLLFTGMQERGGAAYLLGTSDLEGHARIVATTPDAWFNRPFLSPSGQRVLVAELTFPPRLFVLEPR